MAEDTIFDKKLPETYRRFLAEGWVECVDEICFSAVDMVEKLNEVDGVLEALPEYAMVGWDGGSYRYLVELNGAEDSPVYRADYEALNKGVVQIAESFGEWLQVGCPLPVDEDDKFDLYATVPVFFDVAPTKVETLALIRKELTPGIGFLPLRELSRKAPVELVKVSYMWASASCEAVNKVEKCLSVRDPLAPDKTLNHPPLRS